MSVSNKEFGINLKALRNEKHFTVRQAASQAGISNSFWSQVENGKRNIPKPDTLRKIANGLRENISTILNMAGLSETFEDTDPAVRHIDVEDIINNQVILTSRNHALSDEDRNAIRALLTTYLNSAEEQDRLKFGGYGDDGKKQDESD